MKQESQVEGRPAGRKKAVVCVDERVDNPKKRRVVSRRSDGREHAFMRACFCDAAPRRATAVFGIRLDYTLNKPRPVCFCQARECFAKLYTVDEAEARVPRPSYEFFFAHEPVVPVPERPNPDMCPYAREHPIERIVGEREARARAGEDDMTAGSHDPRKLAEAGARVGDMFDYLEAARDVETRIIERQPLGVRDAIFYPRHVRVESACVRNVALVEVAGDKMAHSLAEMMVKIPFAATDVDDASDPGLASDTMQCPQYPALPGTIGWQEEFVVHSPLSLTTES